MDFGLLAFRLRVFWYRKPVDVPYGHSTLWENKRVSERVNELVINKVLSMSNDDFLYRWPRSGSPSPLISEAVFKQIINLTRPIVSPGSIPLG